MGDNKMDFVIVLLLLVIIYKLYVDNRERVISRELLLNELQECKLALRSNNLSELLSVNEESNKLLEQMRKELEEL